MTPLTNPFAVTNVPTHLHINDLELAINFWRAQGANRLDVALAQPLQALATVYAQMVFDRQQEILADALAPAAYAAWLAWYDTTPDTPCIAICSTSQGDAVCQGCGRTFDEVKLWNEMTPLAKRATWRRITQEGTAWRFNRYAERVIPGPG